MIKAFTAQPAWLLPSVQRVQIAPKISVKPVCRLCNFDVTKQNQGVDGIKTC